MQSASSFSFVNAGDLDCQEAISSRDKLVVLTSSAILISAFRSLLVDACSSAIYSTAFAKVLLFS
jgi:hypothetical protein